jgi:primary-amine oxidase
VRWQQWAFRVGFNYREGLVIHDARFAGRPVLDRASLVEMTVPYADPRAPFESKNAGDVSDYGLGFCATSLQLCADCSGDITYFDSTLSDSAGEPYVLERAVCMHEEDDGVAWKHVEYRTGHAETRRARTLVLQSSYTIVNYGAREPRL